MMQALTVTAKYRWEWWYDEGDCYLGFVDEDGTRLVIASMDPMDVEHIVELHNAWLGRN